MTDTTSPAAVKALAAATQDEPERMSWDTRARRMVTLYIPLTLFVIDV